MRYLITGATGYVGKSLCRKIASEENSIMCIIRKSSYIEELSCLPRLNFSTPTTGMECENIINKFKLDIIIHLASAGGAYHAIEDIPNIVQSNVTFPSILVEAMAKTHICKFINIGTFWQNYRGRHFSPATFYAATKQSFCDILKYYKDIYNIDCVTLKLHNIYGPNDHRPKVINLLQKTARTGEHLNMSSGRQYLDFIHIDDVISAILYAKDLMYTPNQKLDFSYVVSTKSPIQLKKLVDLIQHETGKKLNIGWNELPHRDAEVMRPWNGGKWLPGWMPQISLKEGLKTLSW